ncbi:MAG: 23S rRNA (guanosine(2251)-2'-O)-methyltransferase RlmB [Lysobacteraceae bacterium]
MARHDDEHWIAGINAVAAAIENDPVNLREVLIEARAKNPRLSEIASEAQRLGVPQRAVPTETLDRIAQGVRHQGVVAHYAAAKNFDEDDLPGLIEAAEKPLLLLLDGVQDPHNFGACLRSAAAAGVTAVIVPRDKSAPVNATVRKTSAGAADRIPVARVANLARTMKDLQQAGVWFVGLAGEVDKSLYEIDLAGPVGIVMGGEGEGLRRLTREHCDFLAKIPMPGTVESLNVSVATGIALFEAVRQRSG